MNRKIIINFLKDHLFYTFAFYGCAALIITFYWLQTQQQQIEIIYPIILVTFVYLIFMIVKGFRYVAFHQLIENVDGSMDDTLMKRYKLTEEQRLVMNKIKNMEAASLAKVNELELQNDNKYKIISQIIHHVKTPTSVIDLIVQYNQKEKNMENDVISKIHKENQLINQHLDQALDYLRLDFFQYDFSIEETDLVQQLRDLINKKKDQFIFEQVFPQWNIDNDAIIVLTDKKWNKILLSQLISNAIKYTVQKEKVEEKQVSFHIKHEQDRVHLIMEDTGIGIAEHDLNRIYEPFFTGENGRKIRNASGIGLYLCKNIADRMNNQLSITSEVNKGTRVTLTYRTP